MKKSTLLTNLFIATCATLLYSCSAPKQENNNVDEPAVAPYATLGSIEISDPSLEAIMSKNAKIEILAKGFEWVEGPVWVKNGGYLLFSDIFPNTVYKWSEEDSISVYLTPSGYTSDIERGGEIGSNGLMLNAAGQLMLCQHGNRQLAVMNASLSDPKPDFIALADSYEGKKLNSPNDMIVHSNGDIYFTDPPYGLEKNMDDPLKELGFQGVYKWSAADSSVTLLEKDIPRPNGIALSTDEKKLYVADSDSKSPIWFVFDVNDDGTLSNKKIFLEEPFMGSADGMAVHPTGIIFATGPKGVWILSPEGKVLGKIITNERTANCTFDEQYGILYITADSYLLRVKLQ